MGVNLITKEKANEIAEIYLKSVKAVYVTRDGQVFYPGKVSYMKIHEKKYNLEPAWYYENEVKKEVPDERVPLSNASLKKYFEGLTKEGKIEEKEWKGKKFEALRKLYVKINEENGAK